MINETNTILRLPSLISKTGLSKSSIYRLIASGDLPKPRKLSADGRATGWHSSEIQEWIDSRPTAE